MLDFSSIEYLKKGTKRQKLAYQELMDLNVMVNLKDYQPILAGTIPIQIDLPTSDLDIICTCVNPLTFSEKIKESYQVQQAFKIETKLVNGTISTIANFRGTYFEIEIFGQDKPTKEQSAYRHLIIEQHILNLYGDDFRQEILRLKTNGMKTEPAFAQLLKLSGDPYQALLELKFV